MISEEAVICLGLIVSIIFFPGKFPDIAGQIW